MANKISFQFYRDMVQVVSTDWTGRATVVAENMGIWTLRNDPAEIERQMNVIGYNTWRYLGIQADTLPRGVTEKDIVAAYLIARDVLADKGLTVDNWHDRTYGKRKKVS
jgi:hypothetical protein